MQLRRVPHLRLRPGHPPAARHTHPDQLPDRYGPLNFLWPTNERAHFLVDRDKATREAADLLAKVYRTLRQRKAATPQVCQRFALQALVCLFSEDIGLLPKHFFTALLDECVDPPKAFDLLDGLFRAMNARDGAKGGRYKPVPYFNGGIFAHSAAIELSPDYEVALLKRATTYNWAHVSPDIFGTIFQHSMEAEERHAMGAHYTSQVDIMRIVGPTIVYPFTTAIERADTLRELTAIRERLTTLRVLDPACGSGNFLYIVYREMRRLEAAILAKQSEISKRSTTGQGGFAAVSPKQFFGMDVLPFAVELAKVTLSLAPKLASDELHSAERTLPLDNLDANITVKDALIDDAGNQTPWPAADIIIGNPPFLGAKRLKPERGADYVNKVRKAYPDVPGMADYCVYWFRRAHDHLAPCTAANWHAGRAGLVGTQNIRNNQSRVGGLDHIVASGTIVEAVENMPWSGEANVHVSIANWVKNVKVTKAPAEAGSDAPTPMPGPGPSMKTKAAAKKAKATDATPPPGGGGFAKAADTIGAAEEDGGSPADDDDIARNIAPSRRLWTKVEATAELFEDETAAKRPKTITLGKRGKVRKDKSYEMAARESAEISPSLSDEVDTSAAKVLACNAEPQRSFNGQMLGHEGFLLSAAEAKRLISAERKTREVLFPYLNGREFLSNSDCKPERFVLDFGQRDQLQAAAFSAAFEYVKKTVLPDRKRKATEGVDAEGNQRSHHKAFLERWWQLSFSRPELTRQISALPRYLACSLVTKRAVVVFIDSAIRPSNLLQVFTYADDYSFGVVSSNAHWEWFKKQSSKLKSDYRFGEGIWNTFPWPQSPTKKQIQQVAAAGREVRAVREKVLPTMTGGLRALYRTLELPGSNPLKDAHAALDTAVLDAYGFSRKKDLLKQLLDLNLAVARAIDSGEQVTPPGVPPSYGDPADLITDDCIKP